MSIPGREGGRAAPRAGAGELGWRAASGLVLAAVALGATWLGGPVFAFLWLAAGIAIAAEWIAMTRSEPRAILVALCTAGLAGLVLAYKLNAGWSAEIGILVVVLGAIALVAEGGRDRSWTLAGFAYAAVVALVPTMMRDHPDVGMLAVLWMFGVVWTTDVAAYFTGRAFGGPKLAPSISPKKTWSGLLGGLVGATLVGTAVVQVGRGQGASVPVGPVAIALASAVASIASQIGDLAESGLKRRFGAKDSGRLIPGHGGVMDRLDGFAAVALLCGVALAGSRLAR